MGRVRLVILAFVVCVGPIANAQVSTNSSLVLGYTEPDIEQVVLLDSAGKVQPTIEGRTIPEGWTIRTVAGGFAELQLKPEGTLIRIASESIVRFASLRISTKSSSENRVQLVSGLVRVVMPRFSGIATQGITVGTPLATIGSRGADFSIFVDGEHISDLVYVSRDTVNLGINSTGEMKVVVGGMAANAQGDVLESSAVDPVLRSKSLTHLQFRKFDIHEFDGGVK